MTRKFGGFLQGRKSDQPRSKNVNKPLFYLYVGIWDGLAYQSHLQLATGTCSAAGTRAWSCYGPATITTYRRNYIILINNNWHLLIIHYRREKNKRRGCVRIGHNTMSGLPFGRLSLTKGAACLAVFEKIQPRAGIWTQDLELRDTALWPLGYSDW